MDSGKQSLNNNKMLEAITNNDFRSLLKLVVENPIAHVNRSEYLAKVFKVSVSEIFPEDIFLTNIYNWKDYYILNEKLRNNLITIINKRKSTGERQVIKHLSEEIGITVNKIYRFTNNRIILEDSKDLESISNFIKNNK